MSKGNCPYGCGNPYCSVGIEHTLNIINDKNNKQMKVIVTDNDIRNILKKVTEKKVTNIRQFSNEVNAIANNYINVNIKAIKGRNCPTCKKVV